MLNIYPVILDFVSDIATLIPRIAACIYTVKPPSLFGPPVRPFRTFAPASVQQFLQ